MFMYTYTGSQDAQRNICDIADVPYKPSSLGIPNPNVDFSELNNDHKIDLSAQIDALQSEIVKKFLELQAELIKSLKEHKVDPLEIVSTLMGYGYSISSSNESLRTSLFQTHQQELTTAKKIESIFLIINPYISYFNYELLEVIIRAHGSKEDKGNMQRYIVDFSEYCKKVPCVEYCEGFESKRTKIKFKHDFDRKQLTMGDSKRIQRRIAEILLLKPSVLFLHRIEDGCVAFTFLVPTFIVGILMESITKNRVSLEKEVKLLRVEQDHQNPPKV